jgi:hypothetical protein
MNKDGFNRIVLILIILLGIYFRLSYIELIKFGLDQARALFITKEALDKGQILQASAESHLGLKHGAILEYTLSIPMAFSKTPEVSAWFLSLLSIITVYMVFRIGNDFFSPRIGFIASALFATSRVSIALARLINDHPLSLLFTAFFTYAVLKIIKTKSSFYNFTLPILFVILILINSSNLTLICFLGIFLYLYRHSIKVKHFLLGCFIASLIYLPYLTYILENKAVLYRVIWSLSYLSHPSYGILNFHSSMELLKILAYHYPGQKANPLDWSMAILFFVGVLILIWKITLKYILLKERPYLRIKQFPNEFIILISVLLPLVIFLFIDSANYLYYSAQLPLIFILISLAICTIVDRLPKIFLGNAIVFILILSQIGVNLNNRQTLIKKGDKELLKDQKKVVDYIISNSKNQKFVISENPDYLGYLSSEWLYLFMLEKIDYTRTGSIPKGTTHYIISLAVPYLPELTEKKFGVLALYKQNIEEIKFPFLENWRYSFKKETGWESEGFDDSHWIKTLIPLNIVNTGSITYMRAMLNISEGKKYDHIDVKTNGYLLELYIDGKRRRLTGKRFFLTEIGEWQPLIKNLGEVADWGLNRSESLGSGKYTIAIKILTPKHNLFLDVKKELLDITVFNFRKNLE